MILRILLVISIVASPLVSFPSTKPWLEEWMAYSLRFDKCSELDAEEFAAFEEFVRTTLVEGFDAVQRINPKLVEDRLLKGWGKKVVVTCLTIEGALAQTLPPIPILRKHVVVKLGNLLHSDRSRVALRETIFHEFLHVFEFDNHEREQHNERRFLSSYEADGKTNFERDAVYACGIAAFPGSEVEYGDKLRSHVAQESCREATIVGGKVVIPPKPLLAGVAR